MELDVRGTARLHSILALATRFLSRAQSLLKMRHILQTFNLHKFRYDVCSHVPLSLHSFAMSLGPHLRKQHNPGSRRGPITGRAVDVENQDLAQNQSSKDRQSLGMKMVACWQSLGFQMLCFCEICTHTPDEDMQKYQKWILEPGMSGM